LPKLSISGNTSELLPKVQMGNYGIPKFFRVLNDCRILLIIKVCYFSHPKNQGPVRKIYLLYQSGNQPISCKTNQFAGKPTIPASHSTRAEDR
jgi:hypothetical protein